MRKKLTLLLTVASVSMLPALSIASGFGYYEHGAKATAMAGAFVGRADDVTAVFYNPAGIAFLEGTHVHFGMHPIKANFKSSLMGVATDGTNEWLYPASVFFSSQLNENISYGFGFFVPFGLSVDWPESWIGRNISYHTAVRSYYFQPTIAIKAGEQFSIGAGIDIVYGKVELSRMTLPPPLPIVEFDTKVEATGTGYGVNLGALYVVDESFSFGASYKSEISIDYDGDADFTTTSTGNPIYDMILGALFVDQGIKTNIKMPQIFAVGTMFRPGDDFSFQVDLQWTGWSSFESLDFDFENDTLDQSDDNDWGDAWTFRVGGEIMMTPELALRAGYIYDQAAIPLSTLKPLLPDTSRQEVTFGFGYDTSASNSWGNAILDFAIQYIWGDDRTSTFLLFPSSYESNVLILGAGITLSF